MGFLNTLNNVSAYSVSVLRLGRGLGSKSPAKNEPATPLELYEFEACPYCKKVREALSALSIEYISRSCARGSKNREHVMAEGGRQQFPYLVDPNTGTSMFESEDIIDYLYSTYGEARSAGWRMLSPVNTIGATLASAVRPRGARVGALTRTENPEELLVLYNMEGSPYCRKVREVLCELDLDCHIKTTTRWGPRREELIARGGKKTVPYLVDPNTETEMYESDDIIDYLRSTYG
jgi:glutathione S-transferase